MKSNCTEGSQLNQLPSKFRTKFIQEPRSSLEFQWKNDQQIDCITENKVGICDYENVSSSIKSAFFSVNCPFPSHAQTKRQFVIVGLCRF